MANAKVEIKVITLFYEVVKDLTKEIDNNPPEDRKIRLIALKLRAIEGMERCLKIN